METLTRFDVIVRHNNRYKMGKSRSERDEEGSSSSNVRREEILHVLIMVESFLGETSGGGRDFPGQQDYATARAFRKRVACCVITDASVCCLIG